MMATISEKNIFVNPFYQEGVGRRTGIQLKRDIRKDSDGFENFDDYWSESENESTLNVTFAVNKENILASASHKKTRPTPRTKSSLKSMPAFSPQVTSAEQEESDKNERREGQDVSKSVDVSLSDADMTGSVIKGPSNSLEPSSALCKFKTKKRLSFSCKEPGGSYEQGTVAEEQENRIDDESDCSSEGTIKAPGSSRDGSADDTEGDEEEAREEGEDRDEGSQPSCQNEDVLQKDCSEISSQLESVEFENIDRRESDAVSSQLSSQDADCNAANHQLPLGKTTRMSMQNVPHVNKPPLAGRSSGRASPKVDVTDTGRGRGDRRSTRRKKQETGEEFNDTVQKAHNLAEQQKASAIEKKHVSGSGRGRSERQSARRKLDENVAHGVAGGVKCMDAPVDNSQDVKTVGSGGEFLSFRPKQKKYAKMEEEEDDFEIGEVEGQEWGMSDDSEDKDPGGPSFNLRQNKRNDREVSNEEGKRPLLGRKSAGKKSKSGAFTDSVSEREGTDKGEQKRRGSHVTDESLNQRHGVKRSSSDEKVDGNKAVKPSKRGRQSVRKNSGSRSSDSSTEDTNPRYSNAQISLLGVHETEGAVEVANVHHRKGSSRRGSKKVGSQGTKKGQYNLRNSRQMSLIEGDDSEDMVGHTEEILGEEASRIATEDEAEMGKTVAAKSSTRRSSIHFTTRDMISMEGEVSIHHIESSDDDKHCRLRAPSTATVASTRKKSPSQNSHSSRHASETSESDSEEEAGIGRRGKGAQRGRRPNKRQEGKSGQEIKATGGKSKRGSSSDSVNTEGVEESVHPTGGKKIGQRVSKPKGRKGRSRNNVMSTRTAKSTSSSEGEKSSLEKRNERGVSGVGDKEDGSSAEDHTILAVTDFLDSDCSGAAPQYQSGEPMTSVGTLADHGHARPTPTSILKSGKNWKGRTKKDKYLLFYTEKAAAKAYIIPPDNENGLRRTKRQRVRPLEYWRNERPIYQRRKSGGFALSGIVSPELKDTRRGKSGKQEKRAKVKGQLPATPANISVHVSPPHGTQLVTETGTTVINPENNEEVVVDAFTTSKMLKFMGPSGLPAQTDDPITISKALSQKAFAAGVLKIRPFEEKGSQLVRRDTMVFFVVRGKVAVSIHQTTHILQNGDWFFVPKGNVYNIKNMRRDEAKLAFFQHKGR